MPEEKNQKKTAPTKRAGSQAAKAVKPDDAKLKKPKTRSGSAKTEVQTKPASEKKTARKSTVKQGKDVSEEPRAPIESSPELRALARLGPADIPRYGLHARRNFEELVIGLIQGADMNPCESILGMIRKLLDRAPEHILPEDFRANRSPWERLLRKQAPLQRMILKLREQAQDAMRDEPIMRDLIAELESGALAREDMQKRIDGLQKEYAAHIAALDASVMDITLNVLPACKSDGTQNDAAREKRDAMAALLQKMRGEKEHLILIAKSLEDLDIKDAVATPVLRRCMETLEVHDLRMAAQDLPADAVMQSLSEYRINLLASCKAIEASLALEAKLVRHLQGQIRLPINAPVIA